MLPINVDITIITNENVKEFTEISVALCSDGIISFNRMSVRTSRKSSAKEPTKPPRIIRYGLPENVIPNAHNTPIEAIASDTVNSSGQFAAATLPRSVSPSNQKRAASFATSVRSAVASEIAPPQGQAASARRRALHKGQGRVPQRFAASAGSASAQALAEPLVNELRPSSPRSTRRR